MKRILILDDDLAILDVMEEILTYEGYSVKTFNTMDNIFTAIDNYKPDLVLIDYILTGINGGELCAQIKKNPITHTLPVIIMTAYSKVLLSLGTYGCDDFVSKPFDLDEFLHKVTSFTYNHNYIS